MITVLVVDRPALDAEALARTLSTIDGITAVTPRPDETPLDAHRRWRPRVVLAGDAGGTGFSRSREILRQDATVAVIRLVAEATGPVVAEAIQVGCAGLVDTDCHVGDLVGTIRTVAAGKVVFPAVPERPEPQLASPLSERELEVLRLIDRGQTTRGIAQDLALSPHTVRNHVQRLLEKLDAHSRVEALAIARRHDLLPTVAA
jgi:DNA-binding NarL/FixJ family response regulator